MSVQHKQTPGEHKVLGLRVEHQEVNHHQSVGSCMASDDVSVTQDTLARYSDQVNVCPNMWTR